jgi:hypothetical protein
MPNTWCSWLHDYAVQKTTLYLPLVANVVVILLTIYKCVFYHYKILKYMYFCDKFYPTTCQYKLNLKLILQLQTTTWQPQAKYWIIWFKYMPHGSLKLNFELYDPITWCHVPCTTTTFLNYLNQLCDATWHAPKVKIWII